MIYLDFNSADLALRFSANILISGKKINLFFDKREGEHIVSNIGTFSLEIESYQDLEKFISDLCVSFKTLLSDCFVQEKNIRKELSQESLIINEDEQVEHAIKTIKRISNDKISNEK